MLILRQVVETSHERPGHLLAQTLEPLCGARFNRPDAWAIVPIRPGTVRICPHCWAQRFEKRVQ